MVTNLLGICAHKTSWIFNSKKQLIHNNNNFSLYTIANCEVYTPSLHYKLLLYSVIGAVYTTMHIAFIDYIRISVTVQGYSTQCKLVITRTVC